MFQTVLQGRICIFVEIQLKSIMNLDFLKHVFSAVGISDWYEISQQMNLNFWINLEIAKYFCFIF